MKPISMLAVLGACVAPVLAQGPDVKVNGDPPGRVQNETSLLVDWMRPGTMIVAFNDNPYAAGPGIGLGRTTDGGLTWNSLNLPVPVNMSDAFDPISAEDANGWIYAGFVTTDGFSPGTSMIYLYGSGDGGQNWTWGNPIATDLTNLLDKPHLATDLQPMSPFTGAMYATWIRDFATTGPFSDIYFSASRTLPPAFPIAQRISDLPPGAARSFGPNIAVAIDGWVFVVWLDFDVTTGGQTPGMLFIDASPDAGTTFGIDRPVTPIPFTTVPNRLSDFLGGFEVVARSFPVVATSPLNAHELYVVWPADPDGPNVGDQADIFFTRSADRGQNWSNPVVLNTVNGVHEFAPWIEVEPDGTIDVAWYQGKLDPSNIVVWSVLLRRSLDGGTTWTPTTVISDVPAPSPVDPWGQHWLGEYLGLAVDGAGINVAFASSVTDVNGDIFFDRRNTCAEDVDGNFVVDFNDLLVLLSAWGPAPGHRADFNGNGIVEFSDLLQLLSQWGPC